ncbi:methylthioribose kinase-like [Diadema antillarum]|uniref:methylthioribose kinase-like n=1 Tax=Diadema antillarum TaxID=105358 RepID=UPI003A88E56E
MTTDFLQTSLDSWSERIAELASEPDDTALLEECEIQEIGDGNLNDVHRLSRKGDEGMSLIKKHAPPYIKCLGPAYPLSTSRSKLEYHALESFYTYAPGSVPKVYGHNAQRCSFLMEDLKGYGVMKKQLIGGELNLEAALKIVQFISAIHRKTAILSLGEQEFLQLRKGFENTEMVSLTRDYIFTKPFTRGDPTNRCSPEVTDHLSVIYDDAKVLENAAELRTIFMEKKDCLLHGDLHTGSIMTKGSDAKMIDLEFAFVGPMGFDIALLLANYLFSYHAHRCSSAKDGQNFHHRVRQVVLRSISGYFGDAESRMSRSEFETLLREVAGFTGCELVRRIIGAAHVEDLDGNPDAEITCLKLGATLISGYETVSSLDGIQRIFGL